MIPPGLMLVYTLAIQNGSQSFGIAVAGVTILLAPAATMMAAGRGHLTRLHHNLETFRRGVELLESPKTAVGGLTALEDLVAYDQEFYQRVFNTVLGYVRTNYVWEHRPSNQSEAATTTLPGKKQEGTGRDLSDAGRAQEQYAEILQVSLGLIEKLREHQTGSGIRHEIDLPGLDLRGMSLNGDWSGANLMGVNLDDANLQKASLEGANLEGAHLKGADLWGVQIGRARLVRAHLERAKLQNAQLERAELEEAHLSDANLTDTNLADADLEGANLQGADLEGANLADADLQGADLTDANLQGADLSRADLRNALLLNANLRGANLEGANLEGVDLKGVALEGANLEGAALEAAVGSARQQKVEDA